MQIHGNLRKEWYKCDRAIRGTLKIRNESDSVITTHRRNREKEWNQKNEGEMSLNVKKYSFFNLLFV